MDNVVDLTKFKEDKESIDVLFALIQIVQGAVCISINSHKSSYHSVADDLKMRGFGKRYPESILKAIEKDTMVEVSFYPLHPGLQYRVIAATVLEAVAEALKIAKEIIPGYVYNKEDNKYDFTALLEELGNTCRAASHFRLNQFKTDKYFDFEKQCWYVGVVTVEKYWADKKAVGESLFTEDEDEYPKITEELIQEMIKLDSVVEVQAYTRTPVGFKDIYGANVGETLECILGWAKEDTTNF